MIGYKRLLAKNLQNNEFNELGSKNIPLFEIKKRLVRARLDAGLSQTDIAKLMNVSQSVVARFEGSADADFKFSTLQNYVAACGLKFDFSLNR
ncbi:helix-turn-helix transcriptional regulator [Campylobacter sp. faydin G-24]|uniref:Helix-turn-helix transcriptional regulator n=1 Tax=Campylobacter anatolicus TaxID=2829105 RepID=A0ABS5HIA9_9BACT|nr:MULTISPECIES: helix-turn-helix transcriptional regulator [Campylobacter]MBR8463995.1 helix-turn-helix transcriptional regulator [Campylobacter anatolicus]MBR8465817.1 helix-turn-helix transcriptional regulator [Campylobacter anatolicus]OCS21523.1 hypothetical protein CFVI97532_09250 [Campylobacter fetus subsp. venerealis cfvi97/532]CDF65972.1 hypothetical protein CSG_c710 [Campylobacter fetus subsp. venerealis str. 84-112]